MSTASTTIFNDEVYTTVVELLTGTHQYSNELQAFWMAIQGSVAIRGGLNRHKQLTWFHSFVLSVIAGYGGGLLGFIWMGKPSSMLSNDLNIGACIIAWIIVNLIPFDIGYKLCTAAPIVFITTIFAQLFRSTAIVRFINVCFNEFKGSPSPYYPIPVFGPILYGTLLGNMSGFVLRGLEGHIGNGMPWPFQNGIFVGSIYHFYVNDKTGPIGNFFRDIFPLNKYTTTLDEHVFATCCVSAFMIIIGILQLPYLLGPTFTPFDPTTITIFQYKDAPIDNTPTKDTAAATTTPKLNNNKKNNDNNVTSEPTEASSPTKKNKKKNKKKEN